MTTVLSGPAPERSSHQGRYVQDFPFVLPESELMVFILTKLGVKPEPIEADDEYLADKLLFSGEDLFGNEDLLLNLIMTGVVAPGKLRVGQMAVKKIASLVPVRPFNDKSHTLLSRAEYLANAAFSVFGNIPDIRFPKTPLEDDEFLRKLFENSLINNRYCFQTLLSTSIKGISAPFFLQKRPELTIYAECIMTALKSVKEMHDGKWIDSGSFIRYVELLAARRGITYIYPHSCDERPDSFKDLTGGAMSVKLFKRNIHDVLLRGMIEGLAAIGAIELLFSKEGDMVGLRPTAGFLWYAGLTDEKPNPIAGGSLADSIEVDDRTGLIIVNAATYPYMGMLGEFADKMTDTRYRITPRSLLRNCDTPKQLELKIRRLKIYVVPDMGKGIKEIVNRVRKDCDLVAKTPGASGYQLFDIDRKNTRLHDLIVENLEIRKNSMRVEGCRLLVKVKFIPRFREILHAHGFLTAEL